LPARHYEHAGALSITLRSRAIDDCIYAYLDGGGRQVVILGAGFDTRSVRLDWARSGSCVSLIEVDSPGSQALKLSRLRAARMATSIPGIVQTGYVEHDFELSSAEALPLKLEAAGLNRTQPTLVIIEGVLPYLHREAVCSTLRLAANLGGSGSELVFNYWPCSELSESFRWYLPSSYKLWPMFFATIRAMAGERLYDPSNGGFDFDLAAGSDPQGLKSSLAELGWALLWTREDAETAAIVGLPLSIVREVSSGSTGSVCQRIALAKKP